MPHPPRSNPKTRTRAIELRKELTLAKRKLRAVIRNDQLGVNFSVHLIPALNLLDRRSKRNKTYRTGIFTTVCSIITGGRMISSFKL